MASDNRDAAAWGVLPGYHDIDGTWRAADPDAVRAVLDAMEADTPAPPTLGSDNPVWVVGEGEQVRADGRWHVRTEDGAGFETDGWVPPLPIGYHELTPLGADRPPVRLVVSPRRCHLPGELRAWGWAVQLYALRSRRSWGIGDLGDLERFATSEVAREAGVILLNPLHAALPGLPQPPSPYYPSSRCFMNPLYIDVGATGGSAPRRTIGGLNRRKHLERDEIYELKVGALEEVWGKRADVAGAAADGYRQHVPLVDDFATFCALSEVYGRPWSRWPAEVRRPDGPGITEFRRDFADRIRFHVWLQSLLDEQLGRAAAHVPLMQDLAVGVDPAGADAWMWQDALALDARVGAPPDEFNRAGQDWGLPPLDPWRLRAARFEPFIQTLRAALRHGASIRVDHVMGLFRLYWIPPGGSAEHGVYVRYPSDELLDILAVESVRAGAFVVGEDLGTVEDSVREELARRRVLSYRLLYFEPEPPSEFPVDALAAVTTHDLPTVAGLWSGTDLDAQRRAGVEPNDDATEAVKERIGAWTGVAGDAPAGDVVRGCYSLLSEAPSRVVVATLDDALEVEDRPNMPGTVDSYPNWSIPLPMPLEEIVEDDRVAAIASILRSRARSGPRPA